MQLGDGSALYWIGDKLTGFDSYFHVNIVHEA